MPAPIRTTVLALLCSLGWAGDDPGVRTVVLQAPLTTVVRSTQAPAGGALQAVRATLVVPPEAPADLGVGVFVVDQHGRWFQGLRPGVLAPGTHALDLAVSGEASLIAPGERGAWTAATAAQVSGAGLFLWSASTSRATLTVRDLVLAMDPVGTPAATSAAVALRDLHADGAERDGRFHATTGARWSLRLRPDPFPANPFDTAEFALDLLVTAPDGSQQRVPGFLDQPMERRDRGDREVLQPSAAGAFTVRFRPRQPGSHRLRLEARWGQGEAARTAALDLPALEVAGHPWDGYVRIDRQDPRFFSVAGRLYWPLGPNLRSVYDTRGADHLRTVLTPDRGTLAYESYLRRLAAHGVTAVEVWLSSWNLALEWRGDWPGFHGQGRYNLENAWRLDHLLDFAHDLGIRLNLVIYNHGQASTDNDAEWASNPYNRARGGRVRQAAEFFSDPWALAGQENLRRYLVARYADHPGILGWKLWSEVNLTAGRGAVLRRWHEQAAAAWKALDGYGHPLTTHWCGDYQLVDREIAAQPGIDYLCIDAYHGPDRLLADLLWRSTMDPVPRRGLANYGKPVLTTEFGGNWDACSEPQMVAEHASGPWAGLVSGHAGSPMLWWFEWLDQGNRFTPYRALAAFLRDEDLRGAEARSIVLGATSPAGALWCRGWSRPGRMLGYLMDQDWGRRGREAPSHEGAAIEIGSNITPGRMTVEWWDADAGAWNRVVPIDHPGGALRLQPPAFQRHIAFKLYRENPPPTGPAGAASARR
jgi:hypothetical protein